MTISADSRQRIDAYLEKLRKGLRGVSAAEAHDIVEELRSHILDKAGSRGEITAAAVEPVLAALGSPEELATQYRTDDLLARAEKSRSPLLLVRALMQWARLSIAGILVSLACACGYFLGGCFILGALLKPIHPHTAGLWSLPGDADSYSLSLSLGFGDAPPIGGRELLGWWIIPLGLLGGVGLCWLTTRFVFWCARHYRASRARMRP